MPPARNERVKFNFYLVEKEQFPEIRKLLKLNYESEYSKAQLCGKKRVFAVKWSPLQRENRNLLSIFYLALQSVSSSCTFYFRNLIADTEVGTKMGTTDKQKALKSCDFKAFCWWGKVISLFLRKKSRRLQRATGTLLRAAFRIHLRLKSKNSDHPDGCSEFLVGEGGFEPPKSLTTDLQSAPFGHSGIPPYSLVR